MALTLACSWEKKKGMKVDDITHLVTLAGGIANEKKQEKNSLVYFIELKVYLVCNTDLMPSLQNCRIFQFGMAPG